MLRCGPVKSQGECCTAILIDIGNPELLKGTAGYWSRRINEKDRLVYKIGDSEIMIAQCRTHYGDH